ncbi:hypothetical protein [Tropicimonas marinistellae]|uniref:hypothetical protein n=1 Tax=Tropicimonas marinistellae TaxID=1739787 RepID=UPI00191A3338|nr:hypothetical protein [Tropicimonas marinistellae]
MTKFVLKAGAGLALLGGLAGAGPVSAEDNSAAQANNPLANTKALNFQNQYFGELQGTGRDANQFFLRYAQPFRAFGGDWLMRATLPVNTIPLPGGGDETGVGDLNIFAAYLFDTGNPAVSFGIGPQVTAPTAVEDTLGSGKWSLGLANVLFNGTSPTFQWGYLLTWQASVGGDDDRADVNLGAFQPFGFYQLGQGWYLRSASVWTYNFETDDYAVPLSLGLGKVIRTDRAVVNVFAEPQKYVWTSGDGQPEWGVFAGVNFQF